MLGMQLVGVADQPAVPGDAGLEVRVVGRVEPDDPAAPAEAGDAELGDVGLAGLLGPGDRRVEVGHDLRVGNLGDDLGDDLVDIL